MSSVGMSFAYVREKSILKEAYPMPKLSPTEQTTYALHKSVQAHNREAAQVALLLDADINAHDAATGYTPLIAAVVSGDVAMVRMLLSCGADCDKSDINGVNVHVHLQQLFQKKEPYADAIMSLLAGYE
jgi:hypothetical protein